jgi:serine/threonine protein kinase/tetratricopeptide (TPR) repeat protein
MIGQTIAHYKILEKLGEGGMGVVYKAHDTTLNRTIALKFLPDKVNKDETAKARFLQEAQAAAGLNHPNICTIFGVEEYDGKLFISMEYIEGGTLSEKIPFSKVDDAITIATQIGEALQEAHAKGIVHRDIKADNIMLTSKGQAKVMDFGLAKLKGSLKLTRTSSTVGTLGYMAPEQIQGGEVDYRSDIFSFGVLLFQMLTGKLPFRGEHEAAMVYSIVNEEPAPLTKYLPDLSPELERIIGRALEKVPEDRYQSVADMVSELRRERKKTTKIGRLSVPHSMPPSAEESSPVVKKTSAKKKAIVFGSIGLLLLAVGAAIYLYLGHGQGIDSLAVLPFENVGASPEQEYLSDGLTESIINNLTKASTLRVVPRSTVFRFKGKGMDVQEVGSKLNVRAVLSGTITHRDQVLDVQVDLIDVNRQSELWGNLYHSSMTDLLSLQQQITDDVSSKLGIGLSTEAHEKLAKESTGNTQAYQLYLQGRYYWNKRNAAALERAIDYFRQAIAQDSTYALAYSGLADCYIIQSQYSGIPTSITIPEAMASARHALELDNSLAEAHTDIAFCYYGEWNYDDAEREFKQAIALNPRYVTSYQWYHILLGSLGRHEEASAMIQKAHELDPFSPIITINLGTEPMARGQFEEALGFFAKSVELDPMFAIGYEYEGIMNYRLKNYSEAEAQLQKAVELSGRSSECISSLGYFYGKRGMREKALALLKENERRYSEGTGSAYNIARIYAGLGDKEKAIELLKQDLIDHSTWIGRLLVDNAWDDIRTDPRFIALTKKVGLTK